jgi:hypothetical protein
VLRFVKGEFHENNESTIGGSSLSHLHHHLLMHLLLLHAGADRPWQSRSVCVQRRSSPKR